VRELVASVSRRAPPTRPPSRVPLRGYALPPGPALSMRSARSSWRTANGEGRNRDLMASLATPLFLRDHIPGRRFFVRSISAGRGRRCASSAL